ncbi:Protein kinase domain-containing protein [Meloidogyne graminicola]|uniref:Protein kinase domain-containing protein n=1 Tax=Meloidogyne graminicola TaxID=189291 RepID=A0A8S9ZQE5_9BILA|nr:Protein kinase domain-containing protein [Meloidogyne graminicola]
MGNKINLFLIDPSIFSSILINIMNDINDKATPSVSISMDSNISGVRMRKIRRVGTACSDYQAKENDELSLRHGSVVEILNDDSGEDGWVVARIDKKKGIVPKKFVVLVGSSPVFLNAEDIKREQLLDSGAMANVFRGFYKNQEVALKIPKKNTTQNVEDLEREALILSRLNHENIVGFYGFELETPLIALEFCPGGNLLNLYRKMTSSDILTVIYWAKQVAGALEHLHSRNDPVIYADLKAENDFNVSITGTIKYDGSNGSVPWMSPEVLECSDYTVFSDVWSFANFLWEVLSRRIPYKNHGFYAIHSFLEKDELPLPLPSNLPDEIFKIFKNCWIKNPSERSSIKDIVQMLDIAEQNIDNNYKWILPKEESENVDQTPTNDSLTNKNNNKDEEEEELYYNNSKGESIKIPIYEAIMLIQRYGKVLGKEVDAMKKIGISIHPPAPPKRLKKSKLNKESIGPPKDFRHNVSARIRSSSSDEKVLVIHRGLNQLLDRHRSHDSLLDQTFEDNNKEGLYLDSPNKTCNHPNKFRQHQYLTLSTCNNNNKRKCLTKNSEEFVINNKEIKNKGLNRTNAVRPKICEQIIVVDNTKK